jgi:polysaccharide export outer membrane protein
VHRILAIILLHLLLAACSLPAAGPSVGTIRADEYAQPPTPDFLVIKVDERVTNITGQYRPLAFSNFLDVSTSLPTILIGKGDRLLINVFEAGADGLFSSEATKATQITVSVDDRGQIFVPYVGTVAVAGRSIDSVRSSIENALVDKAIQPQVQVLVEESLANSASVVGDVSAPGRYPIAVNGTRVLDLVALAGGSKVPTYQTRLTLKRGAKAASATLEDLFDSPQENVLVRPADTLLVSDTPRTFTVFGATGSRTEVPFNSRHINLSEALARVGGLNARIADPRGVFVFRFEEAEIAKQLDERAVTAPQGVLVPVIYRVNLRDPQSFFLTTLFEMRDEDLIYVAQSPIAEFGAFLDILSPLLGTVQRTTAFAE